ncbi:acyl transferase/acyl hydrolase/lysophospholipase [Chytriomyces sp. MP71]|nr:acyl transferase/acyl hydrolase/lysophospholipase [Chytriomyces sp. MP71]
MESRLSLLFYLLRYPLLILILLVVLLDLIALSLVRLFVSIYESTVIWHGQQRKLWKTLRASRTFSEWRTNAERLDSFMKHDQWRLEDDTQQLYNAGLVRRSIRKLREARMKDSDPREVMKHLSHACKKNHAGSMNEGLFTNSYVGTKADVEDFFAEVETSIKYVTASKNVTSEEKSVFFKSVSRNFGRTALSLSGGGSITYYHMGVLKALFEQNLLPDVISGTSGGSLLAAIVCTRTDEELRQDKIFDPAVMAPQFTIMKDSWMARFQRLFSEGYLFDVNRGFENVGELTKGHMTFLEAYQKTGRVLCITVTPDEANTTTPSKVLNFMTAPDVIISSAVCASCALPWVLPSTRLLCKTESGEYVKWKGSGVRWRDGSIRSDVPDLSMLNVSFHIVSQVNPHITIFFYESQGSPGCPTPHRGGRGWRGGFLASSLIHMLDLDLKKWLRLCKDLRLLPAIGETDVSQVFLQQFEGSVTVLPASSNVLADCMYILRDPTKERLVDYIRHGELKTWPKLGMIGHKVRIEKLIKKGRQDSLPAAMKTAGMRRYSATDDHVITDFFEDL